MQNYSLLFLLTLVFGCTGVQKQEAKIKLNDTQGNLVELMKPAERIVCLFDPLMDVIYMLQAQEKLVGIPAEVYFDSELFDYYKMVDSRIANKELSTPGSNELINTESIVRLSPDLVIAKHLDESIKQTLNKMGIAVYLASSEKYVDLVKEMKDLSELTGKTERGNSLLEFAEHKIKELDMDPAKGEESKSVYFSWANGKIFTTAGQNSMMNDCLELAGVKNACPSQIDAPNINPETLIDWNPDIIVMWNDSPNLFYGKKELSTIQAIKNKQIYNLVPMFYYNPHTFKSLCAASAIHHWAYPDDFTRVEDQVEEIMLVLYGKENGRKLMENYYVSVN